jgi:tetratricopeptide (TPR) repeat protein
MTWRSIALALAAVLSVACTQTTNTTSTGQASQPSTTAGATPFVLPELGGLAESVQQQIRDRDTELKAVLARSGTTHADQAAAYGSLGRVLMAAKFSEEAASCFSRAEALAPDDMRWPYYMGHAYLRSGDRAHAAAAFERAVKVKPSDLTSLVWLGESYLDDDRLDLAQAAFQRAIAVQPQSAAALFGAGRTALARREFAQAAQDLERALALDARASAIHYPLAMAYRGLGDAGKADAHLRQRGGSYPVLPDPLMQDDEDVLESAVSYENRGMEALRGADFTTAIGAFRKGLALAPDDTSLRYWLGAALYASGNADGAVSEFSEVVRRDPDFAKAHFSLGAIYDARQQRGKAIEEYQAAVRADPNLPESRLRLAEDLRTSGQLAASVEHYEAAVKLDPTLVEAWIGGAHALSDLKRIDKANDWLTRARRLFPNRSEFAESHAGSKNR